MSSALAAAGAVMRDWRDWHAEPPPPGIGFFRDDENPMRWMAFIDADSPSSVFYPGRFWMQLDFPVNYPFEPPHITLLTPICHPLISWSTHELCLNHWSPAAGACRTVLSLRCSLLRELPDWHDAAGVADLATRELAAGSGTSGPRLFRRALLLLLHEAAGARVPQSALTLDQVLSETSESTTGASNPRCWLNVIPRDVVGLVRERLLLSTSENTAHSYTPPVSSAAWPNQRALFERAAAMTDREWNESPIGRYHALLARTFPPSASTFTMFHFGDVELLPPCRRCGPVTNSRVRKWCASCWSSCWCIDCHSAGAAGRECQCPAAGDSQ